MKIHFSRRQFIKKSALFTGAAASLPLLPGCVLPRNDSDRRAVFSPAKFDDGCLAGDWSLKLDPQKRGVQEQWFAATFHDEKIHLPGSTDDAGYGPENAESTTTYLSRVRKFEGQAWYQCEIQAPAAWKDKRLTLFLERCLWETEVWIDDKNVGVEDTLMTPHIFDLTGLSPGPHRLTIRVDSTPKGGPLRGKNHAYTDYTQTVWNGLIGRLEIIPQDKLFLADVQVYPDVAGKTARVVTRISNLRGLPAHGRLSFEATLRPGRDKPLHGLSTAFTVQGRETVVETVLAMGDGVKLWDEFTPNLYDLTVRLDGGAAGAELKDEKRVVFGMRDFGTKGTQFMVNGRITMLRGTHDGGNAPLRGYPDMDVESWRRIYRIGKSYGLNHWRFHSWTPPEAAFAAADEEGIYLQVEMALFADIGKKYPPGAAFDDEWRRRQLFDILNAYGNHPSFCMITMGNEITGDWVGEALMAEARTKDPRRLYATASNDYSLDRPHQGDQFWVISFGRDFIENRGRAFFWIEQPRTDRDYRDLFTPYHVPAVTHELGQWYVYPNLGEIPKYRGNLRARNLEVFRGSLAQAGMLDQAGDFLRASGQLSAILYREEIERTLRTPNYGGFQLLDLHDYPGQGSAAVGMLDAFWDSKGFLTPEQFRRYCSPTVPLLRMSKRVYTSDETFTASAELANYGASDLTGTQPVWSIRDERGRGIASGQLPSASARIGRLTALGEIQASLVAAPAPCKLNVSVGIRGTKFFNDWDIWVYPAKVETNPPPGVMVADEWSTSVKAALANGGRVLLLPKTLKRVEPVRFTTVFWSPFWFPDQPMSCGLLCDPHHPALAQFPTESHVNWQWWELLSPAQPVAGEPNQPFGSRVGASLLNGTLPGFRPILQVIDQPLRNNKEGVLWETRVGPGCLLVCTLDLTTDLNQRVVARQLRHSLLSYVASGKFASTAELQGKLLDQLLQK
jgi:hypothetical protein